VVGNGIFSIRKQRKAIAIGFASFAAKNMIRSKY